MVFQNRKEAGGELAKRLLVAVPKDPVIFGLARGGVVVASKVAKSLRTTLEPLVVRKLGVPTHPELGFGAIAPGSVCVLNQQLVKDLKLTQSQIETVEKKERMILEERIIKYGKSERIGSLAEKTAIIVDDGIATGYTVLAGIEYLRLFNPEELWIATPVVAPDTIELLNNYTDGLFYLDASEPFFAVGQFYLDFPQVSDEEVIQLLKPR